MTTLIFLRTICSILCSPLRGVGSSNIIDGNLFSIVFVGANRFAHARAVVWHLRDDGYYTLIIPALDAPGGNVIGLNVISSPDGHTIWQNSRFVARHNALERRGLISENWHIRSLRRNRGA